MNLQYCAVSILKYTSYFLHVVCVGRSRKSTFDICSCTLSATLSTIIQVTSSAILYVLVHLDLKYTAFFHAHLLHKRNQLLSRAFILTFCRLFCVYSSLEPSHICSAQKTARLNTRDTRKVWRVVEMQIWTFSIGGKNEMSVFGHEICRFVMSVTIALNPEMIH